MSPLASSQNSVQMSMKTNAVGKSKCTPGADSKFCGSLRFKVAARRRKISV